MKRTGGIGGAWIVISGLALAAGAACEQPPGARDDAPGQLRAALAGPAPAHGVTAIRFRVVASGRNCFATAIAEVTKPLEAETLPVPPGSADGAQHRFADALFTLAPGAYHVCATPLAGANPSDDCPRAEAETSVGPGFTQELVMTSQCFDTGGSGGLDVVGVLNDPPHIDLLTVADSKFVGVCERATLSVTASDPNGDALQYAWRVEAAPPGAMPGLGATGPSTTFVAGTPGEYLLSVTVNDSRGAQAFLSFPMHVSGEGSFTATPTGCEDQRFTEPDNLGALINEGVRIVGQTYTAGLTGVLRGVAVDVQSNRSTPLRITIRTAVNGVPTLVVLGQTTLGTAESRLDHIITFATPIAQVAGHQYAILADYPSGPPPGAGMAQGTWGGAVGNLYTGGSLVGSQDGVSWGVDTTGGDLHFITYVTSN